MSVVQTAFDAEVNFTITLNALANGAGRQSTIVTNANNRGAALIYANLEVNAGVLPTVGSVIELYLLRGDGNGLRDDLVGAVDAAYTPINAPVLGTLVVPTGVVLGQNLACTFDTSVLGPLGPEFGIGVYNRTGQALGAGANMQLAYRTYLPSIV